MNAFKRVVRVCLPLTVQRFVVCIFLQKTFDRALNGLSIAVLTDEIRPIGTELSSGKVQDRDDVELKTLTCFVDEQRPNASSDQIEVKRLLTTL